MEITDGLITLGGVVLGALLTQSSEWIKSRIDKRQRYNHTLFSLLDVYHALRRCDSRRADKLLQRIIRERFPSIANDPLEFNKVRLNFIQVGNGIIVGGLLNLEELEKTFQSSVISLAPIDPWMAYALSGRVDSLKYIRQFKDLAASLSPDKSLTDEDILNIETVAKPKLIKDILEMIEEDILQISRILGRKLFKVADIKLTTIKNDSDKEVEEKISAYLDYVQQEGVSLH